MQQWFDWIEFIASLAGTVFTALGFFAERKRRKTKQSAKPEGKTDRNVG